LVNSEIKRENLRTKLNVTHLLQTTNNTREMSVIVTNVDVFVFMLATLLFYAASLCVIPVILFLRRFDVARSVPLPLPRR
jgi:hypothetical protein